MLSTSTRLLQLLTVLQARRDWPGPELAERLDVTDRTLRRDIDRIRQLGYTIEATPGVGGGYHLGHGTGLPPLLLDGDEAVAVALALRSVAVDGLVGVEQAAVGALVKLEQTLPAALRRRVALLQQTVSDLTGPGPSLDVGVLLAVATAVRDRQQLRAEYADHSGSHSRRLLEPHRVVRSGDRWYLLAWDADRADWRTFRLDRLTPRTPLGRRFDPRPLPPEAAADRVSRGITDSPYRYHLRLTAVGSAATVGERVTPARGRVRAVDEQHCEVTGGGDDLELMALWVARLGLDVVVHEPPELLPHLEDLAIRLQQAASGLLTP